MSTEHDIRYGIDFTELADWAESDESAATPALGTTFHGDDAVRASREFLGRGRPTLGASRATGEGRSPRRQVRLDAETNARLDAYADQTGSTASEIIRAALQAYLPAA